MVELVVVEEREGKEGGREREGEVGGESFGGTLLCCRPSTAKEHH